MGVVIGLDVGTQSAKLVICDKHAPRGVVEGLGYAIRANADAIVAGSGHPQVFVAVGGASRSRDLLQFFCDIAGIQQDLPEVTIGAAFGDAMLAARAVGWEAEPGRWDPAAERLTPYTGSRASYDSGYRDHQALYAALRQIHTSGI